MLYQTFYCLQIVQNFLKFIEINFFTFVISKGSNGLQDKKKKQLLLHWEYRHFHFANVQKQMIVLLS